MEIYEIRGNYSEEGGSIDVTCIFVVEDGVGHFEEAINELKTKIHLFEICRKSINTYAGYLKVFAIVQKRNNIAAIFIAHKRGKISRDSNRY